MSTSSSDTPDLDLVVDLNSEDGSGLPRAFIDEAHRPELIREGARLVVGQASARALAQAVEIDGNVVRVRPLRGPVSTHRQLLGGRVT